MQRLIHEAILVHTAQSVGTTNTRTNTVTNLRQVDILVELVRVGDTGGKHSLSGTDQNKEGHRIHLLNNIVGDTIAAGVPACGHLTGDKTIELQSLGDKHGGTLAKTDSVLSRLGDLEDLDLVSMLTLELFGCLLRRLERFEVLLDDNFLEKLLLLRIVSLEQLGLDETDTSVLQDVLLVLGLDILVINGLTSLGINPTRVGLPLEGTVVVLNQTHDPRHFNAALQ